MARPDGEEAPRVSRVLELTGAALAVSLPEPEDKQGGAFAFARRQDAVLGNQGLLLVNSGPARMLSMPGNPWRSDRRSRLLRPGLNLVSHPRRVPADETAESLRQRSGADFVACTEAAPGGVARFRVYLPGSTVPFVIRADRSYLVSTPASRLLTFPTCGD